MFLCLHWVLDGDGLMGDVRRREPELWRFDKKLKMFGPPKVLKHLLSSPFEAHQRTRYLPLVQSFL